MRLNPHNPRTIVMPIDDLREIVSRARDNDPDTLLRAAKRLARRALHMRELGRERLACVALLHARNALARALDVQRGQS